MPAPQSQPPPPPSQPAQEVPLQPFMVQVSRPEPEQVTVTDVIVGSFGLTGALVLAALLSGALLAGVWIVWRKYRRSDADAPPTLGSMPLEPRPPTRPPASPDQ